MGLEKTAESTLKALSDGKTAFAIPQCVERFILDFQAVPIQKRTLREMELLQEIGIVEGKGPLVRFFATEAARGRMKDRHVEVGEFFHDVDLKATLEKCLAVKDHKVVAIGGESGSGKTITTLVSVAPAIKRSWATVFMESGDLEGWREEGISPSERAAKKILDVLKKLLPMPLSKEPVPAVIVIDETGGIPEFVRAVCSRRFERGAIENYLGVSKVVFVLVGTGLDAASNAIGSHPESFVRARFSSRSIGVRLLANKLLYSSSSAVGVDTIGARILSFDALVDALPLPVATAFRVSPSLERMLRAIASNPRMTALFVEYLGVVSHPLAAGELIPRFERALDMAMYGYQKLNGLQSADYYQLARLFAGAHAMCLGGLHQRAQTAFERELLSRYGIVADNARWYTEAEFKTKRGELTLLEVNHDSTEVACETPVRHNLCVETRLGHRYSMSAGQIAFSSAMFGMGALAGMRWDGEGFESIVAGFVLRLVMAAGVGVRIDRKGCSTATDPFAPLKGHLIKVVRADRPAYVVQARLTKRVKTVAVAVAELSALSRSPSLIDVSLIPRDEAPAVDSPDRIVVAINAPKSAFADVLVARVDGEGRCTWMVLIQAKHYLKTKLTKANVKAEMVKMGRAKSGAPRGTRVRRFVVGRHEMPVPSDTTESGVLLCSKEEGTIAEAFSPTAIGDFADDATKEPARQMRFPRVDILQNS